MGKALDKRDSQAFHEFRLPKLRRKIPPWRSYAKPPKYGLKKQPVVSRPARIGRLS